jgi:hypothetical protein
MSPHRINTITEHLTKEPLRTLWWQLFSDGCCTINTQLRSTFYHKPLFHQAISDPFNLACGSWPRNRGSLSPRQSAANNIKAGCAPPGSVSDPDCGRGRHAWPIGDRRSGPTSRRLGISLLGLCTSRLNRREFGGPESAACGSPLRRAYRPYRSCGRVAEGGGLLNRYRVVKPYRGFESLRLRQAYENKDVFTIL